MGDDDNLVDMNRWADPSPLIVSPHILHNAGAKKRKCRKPRKNEFSFAGAGRGAIAHPEHPAIGVPAQPG